MADINGKRRLKRWLGGKRLAYETRHAYQTFTTQWGWTFNEVATYFNVTPKLLTKILNYEA